VGSSTITRSSSFGYDPATGILTEEVIEPTATACNGIGAACRLQTDYTLDAFGHRRVATVSGPGIPMRSTSVGYDANGTFAVLTTNALGQSESFDYSAFVAPPATPTSTPTRRRSPLTASGRGRRFVAKTSRPYFVGTGTPRWTTYRECSFAPSISRAPRLSRRQFNYIAKSQGNPCGRDRD
ncbi:MAG: hypothetical protein JOZ72_13980, partial [Alphaproteobacteria bacterium]|nr:hypothetical protein [Alphaproteobacteria bacterium]